MLSVKQGGIKYHFQSLWYDSTWDWTQVSSAIEHIYLSLDNIDTESTALGDSQFLTDTIISTRRWFCVYDILIYVNPCVVI